MKKIKKSVCLIMLCLLLLTGCKTKKTELKLKGGPTFSVLSSSNNLLDDYKEYELRDLNTFTSSFTNNSSKLLLDSNTNHCYSPLSLLSALLMLTNGASGTTLNELCTSLNISNDLSNVNRMMNQIILHNNYQSDNSKVSLNNSIWIKNGFNVNLDYIDTLKEYFQASAYQTSFDNLGLDNIIRYINHHTFNILNLTKDTYNIDTDGLMLLLVNTLYFESKFKTPFLEKDSFIDSFYGNKMVLCNYMTHLDIIKIKENNKYLEIVCSLSDNNNLRIIMPLDLSTIEEVLALDVLLDQSIYDDKKNLEYVKVTIPSFSIKTSYMLNDLLKEFGMKEMFTTSANFSKMTSELLKVAFVKQDSGIIINESGAKAGSVTSIGMNKSASPTAVKEVIINKPFIYQITDEANITLFTGVVVNPTL